MSRILEQNQSNRRGLKLMTHSTGCQCTMASANQIRCSLVWRYFHRSSRLAFVSRRIPRDENRLTCLYDTRRSVRKTLRTDWSIAAAAFYPTAISFINIGKGTSDFVGTSSSSWMITFPRLAFSWFWRVFVWFSRDKSWPCRIQRPRLFQQVAKLRQPRRQRSWKRPRRPPSNNRWATQPVFDRNWTNPKQLHREKRSSIPIPIGHWTTMVWCVFRVVECFNDEPCTVSTSGKVIKRNWKTIRRRKRLAVFRRRSNALSHWRRKPSVAIATAKSVSCELNDS